MPFISTPPVHVVEGFREHRLTNGLRVVLYRDDTKPSTTVCMTYRVGSRCENYGETGMAHLLEHLMFKGSANVENPTKAFTDRGFEMNGSTSLDFTNYFLTFKNTGDNLDFALFWHADAMVNSNIARSDLDTEMTVVRNEYEMGENNPFAVLFKRVQGVAFDWHSYGRPTIGARSDIENVEIENLRAFYRHYYQPDNATLVIAGNFEEDEALALVDRHFGEIPRPGRTLRPEWTVEPVQDGEREVVVRRPGDVKLCLLAYHLPSSLSPEWQPLVTATEVIGEGVKSRLHKALVKTGKAAAVGCWPFAALDPNLALFYAQCPLEADLDEVKRIMADVIENDLKRSPATDEEVRPLVQDELTNFEREFSDTEELATELSDYIALGDWRLRFADRDDIAGLKTEDVNAAAARWFVASNRTTGLFIPEEKSVRAPYASRIDAGELLSGREFSEVDPNAGEAFDASQEHINRATRRLELGGLQVALLPKKSAGRTVTVRMDFDYATYHQKKADPDAIMMLATLKCGTRHWNAEKIADLFSELKLDGSAMRFVTDREHIVEAIGFVSELLAHPTFPADEVADEIRKTLTNYEAMKKEPLMLARSVLAGHFNRYPEGDWRHAATLEETIAMMRGVTVETIRDFWRDAFSLEQGRIAVVGDFDVEAVEKALEEKIAGAKTSPKAYEIEPFEYSDVEPARLVVDTPEKESGVLLVRNDFRLEEDPVANVPYTVANWIFGGSPGLSHRLATRVRQKAGLSYGLSSFMVLPRRDDVASFRIVVMAAPSNLAEAESLVLDELEIAFRDGVTADELEKAKHGLLEMRAMNRGRDEAIAGNWVRLMDEGRDWTESLEVDEAIRSLTLEEVSEAMRRMCDPALRTVVLAGDVAKAAAEGRPFDKA